MHPGSLKVSVKYSSWKTIKNTEFWPPPRFFKVIHLHGFGRTRCHHSAFPKPWIWHGLGPSGLGTPKVHFGGGHFVSTLGVASLAGWVAGWLTAGWLDNWLACWLLVWKAGRLTNWLADWLAGWRAGELAGTTWLYFEYNCFEVSEYSFLFGYF